MPSSTAPADLSARFDDYLLHEFDHIASSLQLNEESGEKRVQFFLAVLTAVFGIIGLSLRGEGIALSVALRQSWPLVASCLAVMFLFGWSTLLRLVERNLATDKLKFALRVIRRRFIRKEVAAAHPTAFFDPYTKMKWRSCWPPKGGWLDVGLLLNAVIAAAFTSSVWQRDTLRPFSWAVPGAVFAVVLIVQFAYVERRYKKEWRKLDAKDAKTDPIDERRKD